MFLETIFNLHGLSGEHLVCCPFPHTKSDGTTYYDHTPSMGVNLDKRVYKCMSCGRTGNEQQMVTELFGTTSVKAKNFLSTLRLGVDRVDFMNGRQPIDDDMRAEYKRFGITDEVIEECGVAFERHSWGYEWNIPVFWNDRCFDIRHYRPGQNPKMIGEPGAPTGAIIPYDEWQATLREHPNAITVVCAGEKDMLVARSHGVNAITFTGGEMLRTPLDCSCFKDRKFAICYDNDQPGRTGGAQIAQVLLAAGAKSVRNVTEFHKDFLSPDSKEDLTDWFCNYGGTKERLGEHIKKSPEVTLTVTEDTSGVPLVKLHQVVDSSCIGNRYHASVQVLSVADEILDIPKVAEFKKVDSSKGEWKNGQTAVVDVTDNDLLLPKIIELAGKNLTTCKKVMQYCISGAAQEKGLAFQLKERINVYACTVADTETAYDTMQEFTMYCIGRKPVQGMRYDAEFLRTTDNTRGTAALICDKMIEQGDLLDYELTTKMESSLCFAKHVEGTVDDKIKHRARAVRGMLGYKADLDMIMAIDLTMNTVKEFNYGTATNIKGYLDTLIVGESRVGKSDTSKRLRDAYNLGAFVSLAGSAATVPGIVGGSAKDALGRLSTRAGVIPRNNEGLVIFEELAKSEPIILKSLTDVRSSGVARITRVSGSVEMPARVRMLSLSNVRCDAAGGIRPLKAYANGVEVLTELVGTAEDIARYDLCMLVGDPDEINPLYNAPEPYPEDVLQDLIRWTWTRTADDIVFTDGADQLIYELSTDLNKRYPLHIKLFGSECWKKLARISIAAACYTVSTDEDMKKVLVTPEHVRWAAQFMEKTYNNQLFKIKETCNQYMATINPSNADTQVLQKYYIRYGEAIEMLMEQGKMPKSTFKDVFGNDNEASTVMRVLISRHFITADAKDVMVTVKFKNTYPLLDRENCTA